MIFNSNEEQGEETTEDAVTQIILGGGEQPEEKLIGLIGEISESSAGHVMGCLLNAAGGSFIAQPGEEMEEVEILISSGGGEVHSMFAMYDVMNLVKRGVNISTLGTGHVASAAVVILAAGTKGKRYITRNTRLMMHNCSSTYGGTTPMIKNSVRELERLQEMMIQALADNSNLSKAEIYNMFSKNTDEYFSAEEALEMGLVDHII